MGTLRSPQLAARPFRLDTSLTTAEIANVLAGDTFVVDGEEAPTGWGSTLDSVEYLDLPPKTAMQAGTPDVLEATEDLPVRLRARFYWTRVESRARRQSGAVDDWRVTNVLQAADLLLYELPDGGYSGLVTIRTRQDFQRVISALQTQILTADTSASISTEAIPERLSGDFFLWLFYREQTSKILGDSGLKLIEVMALSSLNRNKGARFKDGATLERIELVSLIATAQGQFGPVKFSVNAQDPEAGFDLELHPDGGFQPYRTSDYTEEEVTKDEQGPRLFDDLWVKVLPTLRAQYAADENWVAEGRQKLKALCMEAVKSALEMTLSIAASDAPRPTEPTDSQD